MKKRSLALFIAASLVLGTGSVSVFAAKTDTSGNEADLVVYGNIYTVDEDEPSAEAIAVKDGKIIYVGDKKGAKDYIGSETETEDYKDSFIMPGIIDGHLHNYVDAENSAGLELKGGSANEYLLEIADYIAKHPGEKIYKGFGWTDNNFKGTPTAAMLDAICPDTPVYIKSEDCHSCWVNTAMLKLCNITAETEDPIGGVIERVSDKDKTPNGCFRDTAMDYLIKPHVEAYSVEEYKEMFLKTQDTLLENGYTAYDEVIIDPTSADNICEAYHQLEEEGSLVLKVNCAILINNTENYVKDLDKVKKLQKEFSGDSFRITDVKIFMDGIVESETAYVSEAYKDGKTGADRWPGKEGVERLNDLTKRINDMGLVAHFHAIGDAAVTKALDAIEYAQKNSTNKDIRNCMTHFQMISKKDIERFAELNVIAVANLGWAPSANEDIGVHNIELDNVGEERNTAMYPFQSMLDAGIDMSYGTDYPAGPVNSAFFNLQATVTRELFGVESTQRNGDECLTIDEALKAMTYGGAYQMSREDEIGTLEEGKAADFIVLSSDLTKIDSNEILVSTMVLQTYTDGEAQLLEAE